MNILEDQEPNLFESMDTLGIEDIQKLRGDLHVIRHRVMQDPSKDSKVLLHNIDTLMDISYELHDFLTNIRGSVGAADYNKLARTLDAGGNAIQGFEEMIIHRSFDLKQLLRNGFSVLLSYAADTAYISSAMEGCEAVVSATSVKIYDRFWALVSEFRTDIDHNEVEKIKDELGKFFSILSDRQISLPDRVTLIAQMYQFLCVIYISVIMKKLA